MCHRDAAHLAIWLAAGALLSVGNNGLAAIVTTHDAATLAEALGASNSGFTVMESIYSGDPLAAAVQTTGTGGIGRGILLTTGAASDAVGPSSNLASRNNGRPGVSFLEHVAGAKQQYALDHSGACAHVHPVGPSIQSFVLFGVSQVEDVIDLDIDAPNCGAALLQSRALLGWIGGWFLRRR